MATFTSCPYWVTVKAAGRRLFFVQGGRHAFWVEHHRHDGDNGLVGGFGG